VDTWSFIQGMTLDGLFVIGMSVLATAAVPEYAALAAGAALALRYIAEILLDAVVRGLRCKTCCDRSWAALVGSGAGGHDARVNPASAGTRRCNGQPGLRQFNPDRRPERDRLIAEGLIGFCSRSASSRFSVPSPGARGCPALTRRDDILEILVWPSRSFDS
jgi:hypothetical protein